MPSTLELGGQGLYSRQEGAASPAMDCQGNQGQADRHVSLLLSCQRLVVVPLCQVQVLQPSPLSYNVSLCPAQLQLVMLASSLASELLNQQFCKAPQ